MTWRVRPTSPTMWVLAALGGVVLIGATFRCTPKDRHWMGLATDPDQTDGGTPAYLKPETPEQRMKRLGTTEDPGPDPDLKKIWTRFGQRYHIEKFTRQWEAYDRVPEGFSRVPTWGGHVRV